MPRLADNPRLLFWGPTLIWASTWHVILYQLVDVPAVLSVAARFVLAASLLFAIAALRGEPIAMPWARQRGFLATGAVQYGLNYWCVYQAERYIPSGLVAVLFSLMVFGNAVSGAWLFGQRPSRRFVAASAVGVIGVATIFWPEVAGAGGRSGAWAGLGFGLVAVLCACTGNALTLVQSRRGVPMVPMLAWCMAWGAASLATAAWAGGTPLRLGSTASWWISLLYLASVGTVAAFLMYFRLAATEGPARAALTGVMTPVIALAISAALEGWRPGALSLAGMALCIGSVYVATRPEPPARASATPS